MDTVANFISGVASALIGFLVTRLLAAIVIVIVGQYVIRLATRTLRARSLSARIKPALLDLSVAGIQGLGVLVIVSAALQTLGLDSVSLAITGSISLIALGIATAASGNLGDIIAGVFLASDPDFGTGFTITTSGITGMVEHVDLRKTRVRTSDGKLHIVPNKSVESNAWIVEARPTATAAAPLFKGRLRPPHLPNLPGHAAHGSTLDATQPHPAAPPDNPPDLPPT